MKQVNILTPNELHDFRIKNNISQKRMCEIMGMSVKSYRLIAKYENGENCLTKVSAWENLQEFMKGESK